MSVNVSLRCCNRAPGDSFRSFAPWRPSAEALARLSLTFPGVTSCRCVVEQQQNHAPIAVFEMCHLVRRAVSELCLDTVEGKYAVLLAVIVENTYCEFMQTAENKKIMP